jgi:hypothetical protein
MQKARSHPTANPKIGTRLPPLVGTRFQVLFHSPPGVLFTFPSRYSFTIGDGRVFSLGGWSPQIQSGLLGAPNLLRYLCHICTAASPTGLSPTTVDRSRSLRLTTTHHAGQCPTQALQPRQSEDRWFGLFPVRSPLLWESRLISLPAGTEMFQFPALALPKE